MPQGLVQPANGILYAGQPIVHEMEVRTATSCFPGRLVMTDTTEYQIKVMTSGAAGAIGVLDVQPGKLRAYEYTQYDQARVLSGPIIALLTADSGGTAITVGTVLMPANTGMVMAGTAAGIALGGQVGIALQGVAAMTKANLLVLLEI
ncbi:hypothetical protein MUP79_05665 [Candidatus Bathyarchaeota archaeon]|nr:hypothetical protein [Candidatus Bathyarchaeota archaeon]